MSAPTTAISRFDLGISYAEFSLMANQQNFIGLKVLPPIGVSQEAASFLRVKVASILTKAENTVRAPKSTYKRMDYSWDTDSYATEEHGVEEIADDATKERYGDILRTEQIAIVRAVNRILQALEQDIANAVIDTTVWTGASLTAAASAAWSTKASADPIADVDAAREKVKTNCGMIPNTLVLTDKDYINCLRTDRIEGLLKYDASAVLQALQAGLQIPEVSAALAALFHVKQVLVGAGFTNSADQGQTASFSRFWSTGKAMLCCVNNDGMAGDLEAPMPNIGRTIFSTKNGEPLPGSDDAGFGSLLFDEYREEQVRGSVFRPRNKRQVKVLHKEAGFLITGL